MKNEGDLYLRQYPHLLKWINQCVACQHRGYKPEMPSTIFPGVAAQNLKRYFDELILNAEGLCPHYAARSGKHTEGV